MPSDSGERRPAKSPNSGGPPLEQEHLPCPRCDSTNTKFCYYNNYNLSQPRHFCKSCRRYWTQGGTLRNIPVGGGSRKQAKRSRTTTSANNITSVGAGQDAVQATAISASSAVMETETQLPLRSDVNAGVTGGSFTALLGNTQGSSGVLALGGFGLGIGSGFEDLGFELGRGVWPLAEVGEGTLVGGGGWGQFGGGAVGGDGGFGDQGECFAWPELAISTPRKCGK